MKLLKPACCLALILFGLIFSLVLQACGLPPATRAELANPTAQPPNDPQETSRADSLNGEIKLAILAPMTGPVATFGLSTRDGAILAIDEWNSKGGVLGKK